MHRTDEYSQHSSIIRSVWLNGWVFVYKLSGCGFESSYNHLKFRFRAWLEQGVPWHSGNYRVWIYSETRTWHENNIQLNAPYNTQHKSVIWPVWLNSWVYVYKLSGWGFKSSCSHLACGVWQILTRTLESLKKLQLNGLLLKKVYNV